MPPHLAISGRKENGASPHQVRTVSSLDCGPGRDGPIVGGHDGLPKLITSSWELFQDLNEVDRKAGGVVRIAEGNSECSVRMAPRRRLIRGQPRSLPSAKCQ